MRGDRPSLLAFLRFPSWFTPHARGSTYPALWEKGGGYVYPACAGIDPLATATLDLPLCLPRMRGDRPTCKVTLISSGRFTPHARGSTHLQGYFQIFRQVYPACAGIDRRSNNNGVLPKRLPRMRGDRPSFFCSILFTFLFTPHARGSTLLRLLFLASAKVYPACAGIDR